MVLTKENQCTQGKTCDSATLFTVSLKAYQLRSEPGVWWWEASKWLPAPQHCPLTDHSSLPDNIYTASQTVHTQLSLGNYLMFLPALLTYLTHKYSAVRGKKDNCGGPRHILIRGLQQTLPAELTTRTQPAVLGAEHTHTCTYKRAVTNTLPAELTTTALAVLSAEDTHTNKQTNKHYCRTHHYYCACCIKCRTH